MADAPTTKRAQARAAMTADIERVARRQLAEHGPDGLSLRAVARELGVVSSAVYRYVASRDELLTLLIIDAYDTVGAAAEEAAADRRGGFEARWVRVCTAVRAWARANPHDHALVYGSPVPGYAAPDDTVDPALRVTRAAISVVAEAWAAGAIEPGPPVAMAKAVHRDLAAMRASFGIDAPDEVMGRALLAWTALFGHLSWELFGHLEGGISDYDALFDLQARTWWRLVAHGTAPPRDP